MTPGRDWTHEMRTALVEQFIGPPRRSRWLRFLVSCAILIAFALAIPNLARWPHPGISPAAPILAMILTSGIWSVHRERLLRRTRTRQVAVYPAAAMSSAVWLGLFVTVSVLFGPEAGTSPIERLGDLIPPIDVPLWLVAGLLLILVFWNYRSQKREEAALRAQADAEQGGLAVPPI
jgi:hypothetical protein